MTKVEISIAKETYDPSEVSFWLIVSAIASFLFWGTFVVFYFSRISAIFFTFVLDKYLRLSKNGIHFRIGSISITGLHAGKIMFRNVIYDNGDMTVKINDGYLLIRYWKSVENRRLNLSKKRASRVNLVLNGLHVNVYNNLGKYSEIARIRRFDWFFDNNHMGEQKRNNKPPDSSPPSSVWENIWNLLGVVVIEVSSGCILVGNKFLPHALWTRFENLTSKTSVGVSENDRALLTFEGETENVNVSLIKNEDYKFTDKDKEPPRTAGNDGFAIMQTASLSFSYKQDLLGYVTDDEPQSITEKVPVWSSEWKLGDNTVISYGPWAEQQRLLIYSFFYPPDYQNAPITIMPKRGQKRIHIKHDVNIVLTKETCMDIWFMRGGQLESIRTRCGANSRMNMSILWITTEKGFYWNLSSNFVNFEATTSLLLTKFIECTEFSVGGSFFYPLTWNGEQTWKLEYVFKKATAWFVWDHKRLMTDLVNDWIGEAPPDITQFIPFRVFNKLKVVDSFEVIMLLNECNWIDPADKNAENVEVAIVGEKLSLECELPFIDFLPQTQRMKYSLKGEKNVALRTKYPPDSATEPIRAALNRMARCNPIANVSPHGTHSKENKTWFEMWRTELIEMKFEHEYCPYVVRNNIPSDIPFAVLLEYLPEKASHPWNLDPDYLLVDILIEGSEVKFTGLLIKIVLELKNNYFGWYDSMTSIEKIIDPKNSEAVTKIRSAFDQVPKNADAELYRPINVDVVVKVCNVRAEMLVYSPAMEPGEEAEKCPIIFVEEVVVEVKKTKNQSLIQVGTSPACAYFDKAASGSTAGCITLSGLQFRGHAMYSSKDVAWDMGLLEYAWIMEILVGDISGTLDIAAHSLMLHQIIESLLIFIISPDDQAIVPERMQFCHHGQLTKACSIAGKKKKIEKSTCYPEDALKYRQIRIAIDSINLAFVEEKTIINVCVDPVRVTVCNVHEGRFTEHVCIRIPKTSICQAVKVGEKQENIWIEGSSIAIEGVSLDLELPNSEPIKMEKERLDFVKYHDEETKRLHFLWVQHSVWGCACFGNTAFFGNNDEFGTAFMETAKKRKFFVPGIEKNPDKQPAVIQSVLNRKRSMLTNEQHMFYQTKSVNKNLSKIKQRKSSADTESFHSAKSTQNTGRRILQNNELMTTYSDFMNIIRVEMPECVEAPNFGEPGTIGRWCQKHPATVFISDVSRSGVNKLRLITKNKKNANLFSVIDARKEKDLVEQDAAGLQNTQTKSKRFAISGVVATSLDIFLSPIGLEGFERILSSINHSIFAINPCLVVHMCYRECALRRHRQPLTETLFDEDQVPPELEITLDLPAVHVGLFQCGLKKNVIKMTSNESLTANMALVLIDRASIQSKLLSKSEITTNEDVSPGFSSFSPTSIYQLDCGAITAQLLQLTLKEAPDFGGSGTISTQNNWEQCSVSKRLIMYEPRVMLDFNYSDMSVVLERNLITVRSPKKANTNQTPLQSPVGKTPTPGTTENVTATLTTTTNGKKKKMAYEHYLKAVVGSITTSVVMARPQELTAGDEFPIYEALAPVMVSWLNVLESFIGVFEKFNRQVQCWRSVAMAKVLKLALDCTDEKVTVRVGKNRMTCTKVLGAHQQSCSSCILLQTLFRWFAYANNSNAAVSRRLETRPEFENETTRKTALMALLSHWQSDVGKELKLVSYEIADQFKVTRPDEAAMMAKLTKMSKRQNKKKTVLKETRIVMEKVENQKTKKEGMKASKLGRMSPTPLLRKLRLKSGNEKDDEADIMIPLKVTLGDIEMQELKADSLKNNSNIDNEDDKDNDNDEDDVYSELSDEEDEEEEKRKNENVDLYTWMRNAQRESASRRRKTAGLNIKEGESNNEIETPKKEYINPMDIQQKAFYYSIYRWARLQWSSLDDVDYDHFHIDYSILLREVDVKMMAKSVKNSTDQQRKYITPSQQKVMQIRNAVISGGMIWELERDEKKRIPISGQWTISYNCTVEGIRFLIGMATVSLGKELSLILQAAAETKHEINMKSSNESTPYRETRRWSTNGQYHQTAEWDEKVLDMTRDFEKHMQRMKVFKENLKDAIKLYINGNIIVSSVVLESVLNDLYVSAMILKLDMQHSKNPIQTGIVHGHQNVTVTTTDERKPAALTRKATISINNKIDDISISLTKMTLTLSESDQNNKKSDILRCSLNASSLNFHTKLQGATSSNPKINKTITSAKSVLGKWATLKLGALEGNMPMAAHSLHDVVMRHGKELEQQFNRLAAQPASTPVNSQSTLLIEEHNNQNSQNKKCQKPAEATSAKSSKSPPQQMFDVSNATMSTVSTSVVTNSREMFESSRVAKKHPVVAINFLLEMSSVEMNIQLLPSLHAKYRISKASSNGITGDKAKWTITIDEHFFEFCVTGQGGKTETFRLLLPSIKCTGHYSVEQETEQHKPSTEKKLVYREGGSLQMTVLLGSVNHMFTTELLNQLMFAEHSFRTELSLLINRIRSSSQTSSTTNSQKTQMSTQKQFDNSTTNNLKLSLPLLHSTTPTKYGEPVKKPPLLFAIKVITKDPIATTSRGSIISSKFDTTTTPWLQLTAATPTQTAVRLTIDSLEGELTNKWVVQEEGSKERIYGSAVIHFNAKLGQLVKLANYDEVNAELQEYATFMTQVRVENKERNMFSSAYSYYISLNRPILLVKAAAIDKAVLLWLNYKNTYDYWRNEKEKVVQQKEKTAKQSSQENTGMFSPTQIAEDADMNLSLAINNGMYMCMPLYSHDVTEGMPALVLSLQKTEISVLVKMELTCKASFNGFKLSFIDDFDEQALTQSFLDAAHSVQSNCFFFPEGTYQLCSKATASHGGSAKWILSVSAEMQGVEIDLDQRIGKLAKLLVNTCSMIGKDEEDDMSFYEDQKGLDSDEEKVDGAEELKKLKAEEKVPWVENKMHEHSRAVFELASRGVSTKKLEAEKHKLRQYELIRFKAFRRNMVEKFRPLTHTSNSKKTSSRPSSVMSQDIRKAENSANRNNSGADPEGVKTSTSGSANSNASSSQPETVNFNLDVKVNITSGTCTLRTAKKESTVQQINGQIGETLKRLHQGSREMKAMFEPPTLTTTSFSIPSVEIKAYHVSDPAESETDKFVKHIEKVEKIPSGMAKEAEKLNRELHSKSRFGADELGRMAKKKKLNNSKRGCFYMFIGLASMPTETVVTPHLATYLEQVLEPLPPSSVFRSQNLGASQDISTVEQKNDGNTDVHNIVAMDTTVLPIDFVLYLDVQSSTIRFDGKQMPSRNQAQADCLLTLPRLTLELTTKRSKNTVDNYVGGMYISGQFKGFMLKIFNPLEPELDSSRALQLSLDLLSFVISRNKNSSTEPDNRVRFVFTSQIGKASFEYNFRRLGELIQFPKPWYRAAIARRVFFGDQAAPRPKDDASDVTGTTRSGMPQDKKILEPAISVVSTASSNIQHKPWTAMVLAAVQWNEFEVTAFMSNTMGKTTWNASKGLLWGDAKLNSLMERDVTMTFVLGSSELCAREGAISGNIKLNKLRISGAHSLSDDNKKPPINKAKLKLEWMTANIEWMSRRVIIAKWTAPSFKIVDFYNGMKEGEQICLSSLGINIDASWNDLQMIITKSTVEDVSAIVSRLISFFDEQLKNSRILLGNFSNPQTFQQKIVADELNETRKPTTHFWEKVLDYVSEMQMNGQLMPLMEKDGAKVGGNIELNAGGISLVLTKGDMNSDTWAVFHLRDACIVFSPEAKMDFLDHTTKQKIGIMLKQTFSLQLGGKIEKKIENLANVCRVQTRFNGSRHLQKTDDILDFFIGDAMKTLGLHHDEQKKLKKDEIGSSPISVTPKKSSLHSVTSFSRFRSSENKEKADPIPKSSHSVLELFQFPSLKAVMTSEQLNGLDDGDKYESAFKLPMDVITTFVCDFFSEVAIETDFNAQVSFLPELLKSYLKEASNVTAASSSGSSPLVTSSSKESVQDPKDPRTFTCKEWYVEPKVRFIDRIKWTPPVVDDILKKLQIFDHRSTIPKVIQRAVLDPLDATLATAVIANLQLIDNRKTISKFKKSRGLEKLDSSKKNKKFSNEKSIKIDVPIISSLSKEGINDDKKQK